MSDISLTREIIYTPPPPHDVLPLMRELVEWLNMETGIHPVLVAGIAQFQLVHIHPFLDGNGRTPRLLSTLYLSRSGYGFKRLFSLSEFYDRDHAAFYRALRSVREQDLDLAGWVEFFLDGLATQLAEVKTRGEIAIRSDVLARQYGLHPRQAVALDVVLTHGVLTVGELERRSPGMNRRTLRRDIRLMLDKGLLREVGHGPTDPNRHYVLGVLGEL